MASPITYDTGTETVELTVTDGVAVATLNRPDRLNALSPELLNGLNVGWGIVRDDPEIRAIVLTGNGRAFCAGADLDELITHTAPLTDLFNTSLGLRPDRGLALNKPVIAAINGLCFGGGLTLMLASDVRFAAPEAAFATPEVRWGVLATCGGTQRLMRQIPHAIAMHMLLSGEPLSAEEASACGLVNRVIARDHLLEAAIEYAGKIAKAAPLSVQATKELALASYETSLAEGLRREDFAARLLRETDDFQEGKRARSERRPPSFSGS